MTHVAPSITRERWAYLKALKPSWRWLHISAPIIPNPLAEKAKADGKPFAGPAHVVMRPGRTYDKGFNKVKREYRAIRHGTKRRK